MKFIVAGGWGIWFVILFAALALASSIGFVVRPVARKVPVVRALSVAMIFSILASVTNNFLTVMWVVAGDPPPDLHLVVMQGLGEAVTPAILGFTVLAVVWLLVAVGTRRLHDRDE